MAEKFKKWVITLSILVVAVFILTNPKSASEGALRGVLLCGRVAIPSLFPLMFLTVMLCRFTDGGIFSVWLLSLISGYPVGARLIKTRFSEGLLSETQSKRSILFCVNAGPAFVVTAVGYACLKNVKLGWLLLAAHLLGSVALFLIFNKGTLQKNRTEIKKGSFLDLFTSSAYDSCEAMLQICGWVILFSCLCEILKQSILPNTVKEILLATSEITSAVTIYRSPIILSFLLGFGGFCVHFQVLSVGQQIRPNYFVFFLSRILHGFISAVACYLLLKIFPITVEVAKISLTYSNQNNILAFCSLILTLLCFAFSMKNYKKV